MNNTLKMLSGKDWHKISTKEVFAVIIPFIQLKKCDLREAKWGTKHLNPHSLHLDHLFLSVIPAFPIKT